MATLGSWKRGSSTALHQGGALEAGSPGPGRPRALQGGVLQGREEGAADEGQQAGAELVHGVVAGVPLGREPVALVAAGVDDVQGRDAGLNEGEVVVGDGGAAVGEVAAAALRAPVPPDEVDEGAVAGHAG